MGRIMLAATLEDSGTARVYVGGAGAGNSLLQRHQEVYAMRRTAVRRDDPDRMAVAGDGRLLWSVDRGLTWSGTAFVASGEARSLQYRTGGDIYIATTAKVFRSQDSGGTVVEVVLPALSGDDIMDLHWASATVGYIVKNDLSGGGWLYHTNDGGATWSSPLDLSTLPGWDADEAPRRVVAMTDQGGPEILLLTSHKVYRIEHNASFGAITPTMVWDHDAVVQAVFPGYGATGYDGSAGTDENTRFDDIQYLQGRCWLGGYNGLRAHSFGLASWFLTDASAATLTPSLLSWYTHVAFSALMVTAGSSQRGDELFPFRPGVNLSLNGGIDMSSFRVFGDEERLQHHSGLLLPDDQGCSDPAACNHDEGVELDDGSCRYAVRLTDCKTGEVLHTTTPALVALACVEQPYVDVPVVLSVQESQSFDFTVASPASGNFGFGTLVSQSLTEAQRLALFISELVAWTNGNTHYRAIPLVSGVRIIAPFVTFSGAVTSAVMSGLTSPGTFTMEEAGRVVRVEEYPGRCFRVCGAGNCQEAENLTLVADFASCHNCSALPENTLVLDCASQVWIGNQPVSPGGEEDCKACASSGDTVVFKLRAQFPLADYGECPCLVRLLVEVRDGEDWVSLIDNEEFQCTDQEVDVDRHWLVPTNGLYRVTITAEDCEESKSCVYHLSACEAYRVRNRGCHEWRVDIDRPPGTGDGIAVTQVVITDLSDGRVLMDEEVAEDMYPFLFILPRDGVYRVEITSTTGISWTTEVIDLCDLLACRKDLVLRTFCVEDPCPPGKISQQALFQREELSRIQLLISQIENEVFLYRYRWTGLPMYNDERRLDVQRIADLVRIARDLSKRCAKCGTPDDKPGGCGGQANCLPCQEA